MTVAIYFGNLIKSPLFIIFLVPPLAYPLQLLFSDYLASDYSVPVLETASLYFVGLVFYAYGMSSSYTFKTDSKSKSIVKWLALIIGFSALYISFAWTFARICLGVGGACS